MASNSNRMMTFEVLDRMQMIISNAKNIPLSKRIMLEKEEITSLMRRLEESIPADLQKAKAIIEQEETILNESNRIASETTQKANQEAQNTVDSARAKADEMVNDAQTRAGDTMRTATDQANAMVADAQNRANAMIADAQARAQQLVADSEIIARAQAEAQEMLERTHRECDDYSAQIHSAVSQLISRADAGLMQQLDSLRALTQDLNNP